MPDSAIKNVPSLSGYYAKVHFGLAAGRLGLEPGQAEECTDRRNFSAVELPAEYFTAEADPSAKRWKERFSILQCGDLLAPDLAEQVLTANKNIQTEFLLTCEETIRLLAAAGIRCGALDFSLASALREPARLEWLATVLRKLHPALLKNDFTLMLPLPLPLSGPEDAAKVMQFLREQMVAKVKLRLEIHPHQLKPEFQPEKIAGTLRLETRSVLFCTNADSGNRLLRAHLAPWLRYFALTGFPGPFLFAPFSRQNRLAAAESDAFSRLVDEIRTAGRKAD